MVCSRWQVDVEKKTFLPNALAFLSLLHYFKFSFSAFKYLRSLANSPVPDSACIFVTFYHSNNNTAKE